MFSEGYHFRRQGEFIRDTRGFVAVDHLFAFERLDAAEERLSALLGHPIRLPHLNRTARRGPGLTAQQRRRVLAVYAEDAELHRRALAGAGRS